MPCARMDSANSANAPSSIRVRGWYFPACSCDTSKVLGVVVAGVAWPNWPRPGASAPSNASSPRPKPLGFLLTIVIPLCSVRRSYVAHLRFIFEWGASARSLRRQTRYKLGRHVSSGHTQHQAYHGWVPQQVEHCAEQPF